MSSSVAAPPDVIRWTPRVEPDHGDCGISALSIACGVTYEAALAAAAVAVPNSLNEGMTWREIAKVARALGARPRLIRKGKYVLDESTGILNVIGRSPDSDHVVYLWEGRIIEPMSDRRQLWLDPEQFLKHYGYKTRSLMVLGLDNEISTSEGNNI